MTVKKGGSVAAETVDRAVATEIEWLIDRKDGAQNFELRKFRIRPGGKIPVHYHPDIEHEQFVLKGDYLIGIGRETYRVTAGDVVYIPAGTPHWYSNEAEVDAEFLCIVPRKEKYQAIYVDDAEAVAADSPVAATKPGC